MTTKTSTAYLGLGSNLGDRLRALREALNRLNDDPDIQVDFSNGIAPVYKTSPVGVTEPQPDFFNTVVRIETTRSPMELLHACLRIEEGMGRVRRQRWEPREIDIDLLLFDNIVIENVLLILPHPRLHRRRFVLEPLCELAGDMIHPVQRKRIRDLRDHCRKESEKHPADSHQERIYKIDDPPWVIQQDHPVFTSQSDC